MRYLMVTSVVLAGFFGAGMACAAGPVAGNATAGQQVFKAQCAVCHSVVSGKNGMGPSLAALNGRPAASLAGFKYSAAMKASKAQWNSPTLDTYLSAPRKMVPGTTMAFPGMSDAVKRANLVAYLATLK